MQSSFCAWWRRLPVFLKLAALFVAAYLLAVGFMWLIHPQLLFMSSMPTRTVVTTPEEHGMKYHELRIATDDGETLHAWFVPSDDARGTVLFSHGSIGNISQRIDALRIWHELGFDVLIFSYRGYGQSTGRASEDGIHRDAEAVWQWLMDERGVAPEEMVLFGHSLGAAVATRLAAHRSPGALVLEAPFISVPELGADRYPWLPARRLARLDFPVAELVSEVDSPVMVIHSREDEVVPFRHGEAVYEAAPMPKRFLELTGSHTKAFLENEDTYVESVDAFLSSAGFER